MDYSTRHGCQTCDECLGVFSPGVSHVCNDHNTLEKLKLFQQRKPIVAEAFATHIIKSKESSPKGTGRLSVLHGPKLPVTIGSSKAEKEQISHQKVIEFQKQANLSQNQTRDLHTFLNKNDAKVVKGLRDELVRQNHILDDQHQIHWVQKVSAHPGDQFLYSQLRSFVDPKPVEL